MPIQKSFIIFGIMILLVSASGCLKQPSEPKCGIENCHSLDITCGPNVPDACTTEYALGDRCRQYAVCTIIEDKCILLINEKFNLCKSCVEKCKDDFRDDISRAFECESKCPEIISETYCEQDKDCACGVHITTGDCFYGNKAYVDTETQCPDFCTGIAGHLEIRCIENECKQIVRT